MQKWEYKVLQAPTEDQLNLYGSQGWELVAIDQTSRFYLKRPK